MASSVMAWTAITLAVVILSLTFAPNWSMAFLILLGMIGKKIKAREVKNLPKSEGDRPELPEPCLPECAPPYPNCPLCTPPCRPSGYHPCWSSGGYPPPPPCYPCYCPGYLPPPRRCQCCPPGYPPRPPSYRQAPPSCGSGYPLPPPCRPAYAPPPLCRPAYAPPPLCCPLAHADDASPPVGHAPAPALAVDVAGKNRRKPESSSTSLSSSGIKDKVFLNFSGIDTHTTITDHLYRALVDVGISVFKDVEELQVGEEIWPQKIKWTDYYTNFL
ncbi:hypothetical protein BT93_L3028 [Corymbia citriodora subsp. variegata]|uniref:ADP-ribosyl cyclase/cyclic ADP-ribose hydrolase n=1 Tax=Corymbia citriodora subsp. variegata TaxID=360336 RepID=A0A8T0D007_CORYI|nr:hypothetical protein BT93_L3028 [Corymbia citriodora subsp. variegata]